MLTHGIPPDCQVVIVPITKGSGEDVDLVNRAVDGVVDELRAAGIRVKVNASRDLRRAFVVLPVDALCATRGVFGTLFSTKKSEADEGLQSRG